MKCGCAWEGYGEQLADGWQQSGKIESRLQFGTEGLLFHFATSPFSNSVCEDALVHVRTRVCDIIQGSNSCKSAGPSVQGKGECTSLETHHSSNIVTELPMVDCKYKRQRNEK